MIFVKKDLNKLDKQVDLLEKQSGISISCHNTMIINGESDLDFGSSRMKNFKKDQIISADQILSSYIRMFHTSSIFFRKTIVNNLPNWFTTCVNGGFPIMALDSPEELIHYSANNSVIYRTLGTNVTNRVFTEEYLFKLYQMFDLINDHSDYKFSKSIRLGKQGQKSHYLLSELSNSINRLKSIKIGIQAFFITKGNYTITKRDVLYLTRKKLTS